MKRGVTLLEMLVTMALILVVIVVAGGLFTNYSRLSNFRSLRDRARHAGEDALLVMREDIESARSLNIPGNGQLKVVRVDHAIPNRLAPVAVGDNWWAHSQDFLMTVHYHLDGDALVRTTQPNTVDPQVDAVLAHEVVGMNVSLAADPEVQDLYTVRLGMRGDRSSLLLTIETDVARMTYLP
ncbi:MAG: type II secretion system protein [Vulcanimicrobiota bacterium]